MECSLGTQVDSYIQRYRWQLIDRDEFVRLAQSQLDQDADTNSPQAAILRVYSRALYRSCSGAEGRLRQEQAYSELTTYLDQIAAWRYRSIRADATQGALERIYRGFAHCRQPETFLAFALQKLRDAAQLEFRSLRKLEAILSLDAELSDNGSQFAGNDLDPLDVALQNDTRRRLAAYAKHFIQEHPRAANQLLVLWLRYIDGLDYPAIAQQLGKTSGAVQVMCSRGMAHLYHDANLRALAAELGFTLPHSSAEHRDSGSKPRGARSAARSEATATELANG